MPPPGHWFAVGARHSHGRDVAGCAVGDERRGEEQPARKRRDRRGVRRSTSCKHPYLPGCVCIATRSPRAVVEWAAGHSRKHHR